MSVICPTILAATPIEYEKQVDRIAGFAERVQVDLVDGEFAPTKTINAIQAWWPKDWRVDLHLMYKRPIEHVETLVSLKPSMVIIHAEAEGDLVRLVDHLKQCGIKTGVALLPETSVENAADLISHADHALIFGGHLGSFGGKADMAQLSKIGDIRAINAEIELGWDGGANADNVAELSAAGIDVINVGSAIQKAENSEDAYAILTAKL